MKLLMIPREKIKVEGYRLRFQSGLMEIEDLVHSIGEHGLLCPVTVTRRGDEYLLVAGERRLYAMDKLGRKEIPAIDSKDQGGADILVKGLVENMVRLDLSPLERALAIKEIIEAYGYTHERVADLLEIDRTTVTHYLRLLEKLHPQVLKYVHEWKITFGHARVLMRLDDRKKQLELANRIIKDELTVKDTEILVDLARPESELTDTEKELNQIERVFIKNLGPDFRKKVNIRQGKKYETMTVKYSNWDEVEELLGRLFEIAKKR